MHLDEKIIFDNGGEKLELKKHEIIFRQGAMPRFFFQVAAGKVRMYNISDSGREYTQGTFDAGKSFGEPPLVLNKPYPAIAESVHEAVVYRIPKAEFFNLLKNNEELNNRWMMLLAQRAYKKALINSEIIIGTPEMRINCLLQIFKSEHKHEGELLVPYTRQEIANMTGLRVETVIRTINKMHRNKGLDIRDKKIFI